MSFECFLLIIAAAAFVLYSRMWPLYVGVGMLIAIIGLTLSSRQLSDKALMTARWKATFISWSCGLASYIVCSIVVSTREPSGLKGFALLVLGFFVVPILFGLASLLSALLIRKK